LSSNNDTNPAETELFLDETMSAYVDSLCFGHFCYEKECLFSMVSNTPDMNLRAIKLDIGCATSISILNNFSDGTAMPEAKSISLQRQTPHEYYLIM
jgi:hypothetical protein